MTEIAESWWIDVLAGRGGRLDDPSAEERYFVLPNVNDPRVIVDSASPTALNDAVSRMVASRTSSNAMRSMAGGASGLFARSRKPNWSVSAPRWSQTLRQHLAGILDEDLRVSVAVGPPRPNRKPVVRCYRGKELFAVAKLGPDTHTATMVKNEARWLDAMAAAPLKGVVTPPLLHSGMFGEVALLVMGSLALEDDLGLALDEVPVETAKEFSDRHMSALGLLESVWWHGLPGRMNNSLLDSVQAQLTQMPHSVSGFSSIPTSAWHGDWSPWNMGRVTNGKLGLWDWERAGFGVPVGFDVLHLHYQYGAGLDGANADLEELGVPEAFYTVLKRLYLFELCARHCEADVLNSDRQKAVFDALDDLRE